MRKIILLLTLLISTMLWANEYAVVSNKTIKKLSKAQIKAIYLQKISFLEDMKVVPLNLSPSDTIRRSFEKRVLHMNLNRLKSYWIKQHYLGHRPPISMKSQKSITKFLANVNGAIGYIELTNTNPSMTILYKWSD